MRPADRHPPHTLAPGPGWADEAACRGEDPELFFPVPTSSMRSAVEKQIQAAKRVCRRCPVAAECGDAGRAEPFGIWGGLTEQERRTGRVRAERADRRLAICERCSGWFAPRDVRSRYCSRSCWNATQRDESRQRLVSP